MHLKTTLAALGVATALSTGGQAAAGTYYEWIDLRGDRGLQGLGVPLTYSGPGGLSLGITGHILNEDGSIGNARQVGEYRNGIGVTTFHDSTHEIDSEDAVDEVAKFAFNFAVTLLAVKFQYEDDNDDFSFSFLDGDGVLQNFYGNLAITDTGTFGEYTFSQVWTSSMFGIGAADRTCRHGQYTWSCDNHDNFKIAKIKVKYEEPPAVPLPAAGWMLLAGLGGIAAMKRRRKAA